MSEEQIAKLHADEEFARRVTRADPIIDSQGVIDAAIGDGIARGLAQYQGEGLARRPSWFLSPGSRFERLQAASR